MGHVAPASDGRAARIKKRGYFVPGLIALAAMVSLGAVANLGGIDHSSPSHLAGSDVSTFLAQGIQAQHGLSIPPSITCPASEPVRTGLRFTCRWGQGTTARQIRVTETTGGQFRFSVGAAG